MSAPDKTNNKAKPPIFNGDFAGWPVAGVLSPMDGMSSVLSVMVAQDA